MLRTATMRGAAPLLIKGYCALIPTGSVLLQKILQRRRIGCCSTGLQASRHTQLTHCCHSPCSTCRSLLPLIKCAPNSSYDTTITSDSDRCAITRAGLVRHCRRRRAGQPSATRLESRADQSAAAAQAPRPQTRHQRLRAQIAPPCKAPQFASHPTCSIDIGTGTKEVCDTVFGDQVAAAPRGCMPDWS